MTLDTDCSISDSIKELTDMICPEENLNSESLEHYRYNDEHNEFEAGGFSEKLTEFGEELTEFYRLMERLSKKDRTSCVGYIPDLHEDLSGDLSKPILDPRARFRHYQSYTPREQTVTVYDRKGRPRSDKSKDYLIVQSLNEKEISYILMQHLNLLKYVENPPEIDTKKLMKLIGKDGLTHLDTLVFQKSLALEGKDILREVYYHSVFLSESQMKKELDKRLRIGAHLTLQVLTQNVKRIYEELGEEGLYNFRRKIQDSLNSFQPDRLTRYRNEVNRLYKARDKAKRERLEDAVRLMD